MKHIIFLFAFCVTNMIFFGCKETTVTSSAAPGDIVGAVRLADTLSQNLDDNSGVKISLVGTLYSALSDTRGNWDIQNVPPGTYTIYFSKEGYSKMKDFNIQFIGNGTYNYIYTNKLNGSSQQTSVTLYQLPALYPDIVLRPFEDSLMITDSSYYDSLGYHHYTYDTTALKMNDAIFSSRSLSSYHGHNVWTNIFFGRTKDIDPLDPQSFIFHYAGNNYGYDSSANISIRRIDLLHAGFVSNETIYCVAYAAVYYSQNNNNEFWYDAEFDEYIFGGFSPHHSEVKSFILP